MDSKHRVATLLSWFLLVASPLLLLLAISAVIGKNAFLSNPIWTDELDYWRSVFSWIHVGGNAGYSGIGELPAQIGTLSVHGLSPLLLYLWFARLFGWGYSSIQIANCLWVSAGALAFCLLARPKATVAALMSIALMLYTPAILYAATSMTELANYGLLLFYLAFLTRLAAKRKAARATPDAKVPVTTGLVSLLLGSLTVLFCCAYRITYIGLFIPLAVVACDYRWSGRLFASLFAAVAVCAGVYYGTSRFASPFASGFLYNFLRTDSFGMSVQMFLSHAKANLLDYFVTNTSNAMESLQRILYCAVAGLSLIGILLRVEKTDGRWHVRFGYDGFSLLAFVTLFIPFAIVVCAYETNDWSDYRTLAPFLWLVVAAMLIRGRKLLPAVYLGGCALILVVLTLSEPLGAFSDAGRFTALQPNEAQRQLCDTIVYDPDATDPFANTVRTDMFNANTIGMLDPHIGIQTGWFTPETVGNSRWILTDHLKIPVEGYVQILRNEAGYVYRQTRDLPGASAQ